MNVHFSFDPWKMPKSLAALAALSVFVICADTARASDAVAGQVQFLWETNMTGADEWVDFLTSKGFYAAKYQAHDADLIAGYESDLVIIGNDTADAWKDMTDVKAIRNSGTPVLAIGKGGSYFYWAANLSIGWLASAVDPDLNRVHVLDPTNSLYTSPNAIVISLDSTVEVHMSGVRAAVPWIPCLPENVSILAKDPSAMEYATICTEASRYTEWGFCTSSPGLLTEQGKKLLENLIWHCLREYPVPEFSSLLLLFVGAIGVSTIAGMRARAGKGDGKRDIV